MNGLQLGLAHAVQVHFRTQYERAYKLLSECYEASGERAKALLYLKKGNALKDSLYNAKAREAVANMMIRYETQKKGKEILELHIDAKIRQRRIKIAFILLISFLVWITLAIWLVWRYYHKKWGPKVRAMNFIERRIDEEKERDNRKLRALEKVLPPELKFSVSNQSSGLPFDDDLILKLEKLMTEEKAYLNENLTLAETARLINTNTSYLSRMINEHFSVNFSAFLNRYRIEEAKRMILDKKYSHLSIEGISQSAGFRSKSTFFQVFKQSTGQTPGNFAHRNKKDPD